jgi:hypothetical protein
MQKQRQHGPMDERIISQHPRAKPATPPSARVQHYRRVSLFMRFSISLVAFTAKGRTCRGLDQRLDRHVLVPRNNEVQRRLPQHHQLEPLPEQHAARLCHTHVISKTRTMDEKQSDAS